MTFKLSRKGSQVTDAVVFDRAKRQASSWHPTLPLKMFLVDSCVRLMISYFSAGRNQDLHLAGHEYPKEVIFYFILFFLI